MQKKTPSVDPYKIRDWNLILQHTPEIKRFMNNFNIFKETQKWTSTDEEKKYTGTDLSIMLFALSFYI